jgi:integrase
MRYNEEQTTNLANETYALQEDELFDILEAARKADARDHALLCVGYWHGLRNQEIARLRLQDLDWSAETIFIARQKSSMKTLQPIVRQKGQPTLCEYTALKTWLKQRVSHGDYVFTSRRDESVLGQRQLNRIFQKYFALANVARAARGAKAISEVCNHIHILKHTRGSIAADKGSTATDIKMLLGHKSLGSTSRYLHPNQSAAWKRNLRAEANAL